MCVLRAACCCSAPTGLRARARAESSFGHGVLDVLNETHALWCGAHCRPLAQPGHRRMRRPMRTALARSVGGEQS